jgi:mono/diheme cytochrome c family protein
MKPVSPLPFPFPFPLPLPVPFPLRLCHPAAALLLVVAACSDGTSHPGGAGADAVAPDAGVPEAGAEAGETGMAAAVTYYQHVAPILATECVVCHSPGGIGPFALDTPAAAQTYAPLIKIATRMGDMPPWPPGPLSPPLKHERRLTADEVALLAAWADAGAPLGDPATAAPAGPPNSVDIGTADMDLNIGVDYVPDSALTDDYRCFLVDTGMTENRMITGYRITPGNRKIVHHVITSLFAQSDRAGLQALDAQSPDRAGWPCVGGPVPTDSGLTADGSLGSWVPGVSSVVLPAGTGTAFRSGDLAVVQVHYNLRGGKDPDRTRIEVKLAPRGTEAQLQQLATVPLFKRLLVLPANQSGIVQESTRSAQLWAGNKFYPDGDAQVVAVAGHMHTLGTRITIERKNAQGTTVLLDIPHWHFHWQGSYQLTTPITVRADDQLTVRCIYDNTAERRAHEGVTSPVVNVGWGEGTEDEMCIGYVTVVDRL